LTHAIPLANFKRSPSLGKRRKDGINLRHRAQTNPEIRVTKCAIEFFLSKTAIYVDVYQYSFNCVIYLYICYAKRQEINRRAAPSIYRCRIGLIGTT
jgi:hypothetical protein